MCPAWCAFCSSEAAAETGGEEAARVDEWQILKRTVTKVNWFRSTASLKWNTRGAL